VKAQDLIEAVREVKAATPEAQQSQLSESLAKALASFVSDTRNKLIPELRDTSGSYVRLLLNSAQDDYQVVAVLWGPGTASPIHDHSETVGAVCALLGAPEETKYRRRATGENSFEVGKAGSTLLRPGVASPILPGDETQLHEMANPTQEWAATIHVYLQAIHEYGVYITDLHGQFHREPRQLWFDQEDAWPLWDIPHQSE
jgi:predicted metal-dependent enzyme (double-stranded beta helix superfamily)